MKKICSLFISLLFIDASFILIGFESFSFGTVIRIIITNLTLSLLLSFINDNKAYKITSIIALSIFSIYAVVQLQFKNFMSTFYSFKAVSKGIGGVKDYILYFITSAKPIFFLVFLSIAIFILLDKYLNIDEKQIIENIYKKLYKSNYKKKLKKIKSSSIEKKVLICINLLLLSILSPLVSRQDDLVFAYKFQDNYDILLNNLGPNHFLFKDLYSTIFPRKTEFTIEKEIIPIDTHIDNSEEDEEELEKTIDDSKWISLMENETNNSIKNVDEYLMSKSTEHETKYTGKFEDYNFIYFLVESFDFIAIDENLTPTLYKLWNESYHFTNHYTPIFSCATGDSEYVAMTGIYPLRSVCTPYEALDNNLNTSLAGLFKEKGYTVKAFHNWTDQFYKRSQLEYAYGVDDYKDYNQLDIKTIVGWQSDVDLIEKALPDFINEDKFFTFFITSSMHWPYDSPSTLGDKYINEINKYYSDYPTDMKRYLSKCMELDKALELLLTKLDEAGKLDDTVISLFADHHPLKFDLSTLYKYSKTLIRTKDHDADLTPFIIYNSKTKSKEINNPCSTIDHVPTIANLFNLNYDPRFYMGHDAFEKECIVVFNNLDWITIKGSYSKGSNTASKGLDNDYIEAINSHVKNITNISKTIIDYDYYEKRKSVIYPEYK